MNALTTARADRALLVSAAVGAAALVVSIVIGNVLGELPDLLWLLCVPIGMLGGAVTCLVSLALLWGRRRGARRG